MSKKPIVLKGLILNVHVPTEQQISVAVDVSSLGNEGYMNFVTSLQDLFRDIDPTYAADIEKADGTTVKAHTRGRTIEGRHFINYDTAKRGNGIRVVPYPSRYVNRLKAVRAEVYRIVNVYCLVLQKMKLGYFERNLYILPKNRAVQFLTEIEALEKEDIAPINQAIVDFRATADYERVKIVFQKHHMSTINLEQPHRIGHIEVELTPLGLDPAVLDEVVAKKVRDSQRAYIEQAIRNIQAQVEPIIHKIAEKQEIAGAKDQLAKLQQLAEETGLEALAATVIVPLTEIIDNPEKAVELSEQYFHNLNLHEGVNDRIAGLFT